MRKLNEISKDELELMSYDDIAYLILEETNTKMKINDLFKKICDALGLGEDDFVNQIADFFEILTTNQKFIMLNDGYWDLRTRYSEKVIIEDEEEEYEEVAEEDNTLEENTADDTFYDENDMDDDSNDDDLKDLVVIDEDEENM